MPKARRPSREEIIASISDDLPVGLWAAWAPSGEFIYANKMFSEIMGMAALTDVAAGQYAEPYGIYRSDGTLYPESEMPFVRALREKRIVVIDDIVIQRRDGTRVHIRAQGRPIAGSDGQITHVIIAFIDISREVAAEQATRALEHRHRSILDNQFSFMVVLDHEGRVLDESRAALELLGQQREDSLGQVLVERPHLAYSADEQRKFQAAFERAGRGEQVTERLRIRLGEGRFADFEAAFGPLFHPSGPVEAVIVSGIDVTARVAAEERLQKSEQRLRDANRLASIGLWEFDVAMQTLWWGEEQYRISGLAPATPMTMERFLELIHPDDRGIILGGHAEALAKGQMEAYFRIVRPDGTVRHVHGIAQVFFDERRVPVRLSGFNQDVTDHVLAEQALRASEQRYRQLAEELRGVDQRKTDFIAMLAHELRNPLSAVRNGFFVLNRMEPASAQALRAGDIIKRQLNQLTRLVDDLLDIARINQNKIELLRARLNLGQLVRETVDSSHEMFASRGIRLATALPDTPLLMQGDAARLTQVLGNLLHNAAKFTPAGGQVTVSLATDAAAGCAVLRVSDTGAGLAPFMRNQLFVPFAQVDRTLARSMGGLGLGLALVKQLVELHGGQVSVRSEGEGRGAEFVVRLPLDQTPVAVTSPTASEPASAPFAACRVLIIEDNVDVADMLRDALEVVGFVVEVTSDGLAGLQRARTFAPDIVLCDIGMPGMSGYEVADAFRADETLRGVTLVALSGYATPADIALSRAAGFDQHLGKPIAIETLRRVLSDLHRR